MEVGQLNNYKIGFVIQARMKSERLPSKVLLPLPFPNGKSLLGNIIDQLKSFPAHVVVATSTNKENDKIEEYCLNHDISYFRGNEEDVLSRFIAIQKKYGFDCIVRLTADNPIIDKYHLMRAINFHITSKVDYTNTKGLPLGMNFEIFKGDAIIKSQRFIIDKSDLEHVTIALKREKDFESNTLEIQLKNNDLKNLRLTIDTQLDFALLNLIIAYGQDKNLNGLELIDSFNANYPFLLELNKHLPQKNASVSPEDEMKEAIKLLKKFEYNGVSSKLENL